MTGRTKPEPKPKLTDAERHARFVETARLVGVDETEGAFDRAFDRVVSPARLQTKTIPE